MNNFDKSMEKIFDIKTTEIVETTKEKLPSIPNTGEPDLKQDLTDAYQQSKENLQELIDQGKEAMDQLLQITNVGQHKKTYEVYGTLLKNMVDANKELLNIQKQMRDMEGKKEVNKTNIDKAIFVGSTAELSKLLKNKE